ncbi:hypothetical protein BEP19_09720 [Ammoniphilus oxalaticus]|uniref:LysM domain-containing protein n=1 Tax=Ammoniphilus oxalaticus TaxID=66863 RepID=A0A419SKY4_9BACL|nr:cell wall hydrolase [Ammoniphilus oxalaticus]RKD24642.1 hypothetical protein BEP19_09720 [Ammoniphilus oxalaticus]
MHKKWLMVSLCLMLSCILITSVNAGESLVYQVKQGDTLWAIAKQHHVSVAQLKVANQVTGDLIHPGDQLTVPSVGRRARVSDEDFEWLVKIIEAEAGGEAYQGKVAVGSVVLNRVLHSDYPNSITDVVFQKVKGVYQFSPVGDGRIYTVIPSDDSVQAAKAALQGVDPTAGAIFFYNPKTARSNWIRTRAVIAEIGQHHFAH